MVWRTNFDRDMGSFLDEELEKAPAAPAAVASKPATPPKAASPAPKAKAKPASPAKPSAAPAAAPAEPAAPAPAAAGEGLSSFSDAELIAHTLQHIVGQLDVLAHTMANIEDRLTKNEQKTDQLQGVVAGTGYMQGGVLP